MESQQDSYNRLVETIVEKAAAFFVDYSFQIIGAVIIFVIGLFVARWASRAVEAFCLKHGLDLILARFMANTARIFILVGVGIICLGKFGISVAPFVAAIGALSLGAGLALQAVVANFGAGLSIMITRPFKAGDTLTLLGVTGVVDQVNLGNTILDTEDGEKITIPNKQIVGEIIRNSQANKIWEGCIGIAYDSDVNMAIALITRVLDETTEVVKEPKPQVGIQSFGDSAIEIGYRYWIPTKEYYRIGFRINQLILEQFKAKQIQIPFPQREVRLLK